MRKQYNFLKKYTYLDAAAGTLKPNRVIKAITDFYNNFPVNPHSPDSKPGIQIVGLVKETRELVAELVEAQKNEVIFTSGTTDSLNKAAMMLEKFISKDSEILLSKTNHASAFVPFVELAKKTGAKVVVSENVIEDLNENTAIVVYAQEDNSLQSRIDSKQLWEKASKFETIVINDAAQAIAHKKVTLKNSHIIAFSSNKLYGPTGLGALIIKQELLKDLKPVFYGGGATSRVDGVKWLPKGYIGDFEAGTPNSAGLIGTNEAIKYFNENKEEFWKNEKEVADYAFDQIKTIENIKIYSEKGDVNILFNIEGANAQDVVSSLGHKNIILRSGALCAHSVKEIINAKSVIRLSIAGYNNNADIDKAVKELKNGGDFLEFI